jgi:hypothetical protein
MFPDVEIACQNVSSARLGATKGSLLCFRGITALNCISYGLLIQFMSLQSQLDFLDYMNTGEKSAYDRFVFRNGPAYGV